LSLILPISIILLWDFSVRFGFVPNTLIASPVQTLKSFLELLLNGQLITHSIVSLNRLVIGFVMGTILGIILGTLTGISKIAEKIVSPTMQMFAPIPPIAWIPVLIILFGIGEGSKIGLITLAAFVVVYLNTFQGIRSTDKKIDELAKAYNKGKKALLFKILLPSAMPNILIGMKVSLGLSWILLIASELIASSKGLGWLIQDSRNFSRPDDMIVGMITIGILGAATDQILKMFEKKTFMWRQSFEGE